MAMELDLKDRKILAELDMGARQPLSSLAKRVGLSREVVNYRIAQLEKRKVILGYFTVLDTAKLGLMYCRIFFKYRKMPAEVEAQLMDFCSGHKNVAWIILGEGKWDIVLVALVRSLEELENLYDGLNARFGLYFQDPHTSIAFRIYEFKHKYLAPKPDFRELVLGESGVKASLDETDYSIIGLLANNARLSLVELAGRLKTTPKIVSYRIKKLVKEKVILAFRAQFNTRLLGYDYYKVFLTLQSFDSKSQSKVAAFLRYHPNVIYITKPIGLHTLEFEAMVRNTNELHELMKLFKKEFGDVLIDYDIYFTSEVRSVGYLPKNAAATSNREEEPEMR